MDNNQIIAAVTHPEETVHSHNLEEWYVAKDSYMEYFEEIEEEGALPDLYGKTLMVSNSQFSHVYDVVCEIANALEMPIPFCFIYESPKCLIDSEGVKVPRLEISSRLVKDFNDNELRHVIAKEMFHLKRNHIYHQVMTNKMMDLFNILPNLPVISILKTIGGGTAAEVANFHFRSIAFKWFKYACFSAENFAVAYTGNIKSSIDATMLTVFNDRMIVDKIDINNYIKQIGKIESCTGPSAILEIVNEVIPYGPYRILNMLRFVISENGKKVFCHFKEQRS